MSSGITHVWFRTRLSIRKVAENLKLTEIEEDCENVWHWIIGDFAEQRIDITRDYNKPRLGVDVHIFRLDGTEFSDQLVADLARELGGFIRGPIRCGHYEPRSAHRSKLVTVREFVRAAKPAQ